MGRSSFLARQKGKPGSNASWPKLLASAACFLASKKRSAAMKGVSNKLAAAKNSARSSKENVLKSEQVQPITARQMAAINRRLDENLPMETHEWQRLEQLLMQMSEFAPTSLVYEVGMAAAVYADNQAHRAYLLGAADEMNKQRAKLQRKNERSKTNISHIA
jgi:hypothetical protein